MRKMISSVLAACLMSILLGSSFARAESAADAFLEGFFEGLSGGNSENSSSMNLSSVSITPGIIYEGNNVVMSVTGCSEGSDWTGATTLNVDIYIENNGSLNLGFNAHAFAVNGIMTRNNIYDMDCDVAAGKKANTHLEIPKETLDRYSITEVKYIDALFWAYDNDKSFKEFETPIVRMETDQNDGIPNIVYGDMVLEENGIRIDYLGEKDNDYWFVITNNTGSYFAFDLENMSINDYTSSEPNYDLYSETVINGCQYIFNLDIPSDFLSLNNIDTISKINFSLAYRPLDDYFSEAHTGVIEVYTDQLDGIPDEGSQVEEMVPNTEAVTNESADEETAEEPEVSYYKTQYMNIRSTPDASSDDNIIGTFPANTIVAVDTSVQPVDQWVKFIYEDPSGVMINAWINTNYAQKCTKDGTPY